VTGVSRRNLSQAVTDELLRLIREGEIREGERLPTERGLMEMFQVGRNTVREAVHALAAQGILDVRPGRGATVRGVSSAQTLDDSVISALLDDQAISDLYDFRRIIEVDAAGRAAERATEPDTAEIGSQLEGYLHAYHERMPTWIEDVEFHKSIARASHNVIYLTVLEVVNDKLLAARRETQRSSAVLARASKEHVAIFEAIKAHDVPAARAAMETHIDSAIWALGTARERARQHRRRAPGSAGRA
jgi:GntR family transcriptional regulator, transcriptional repressor for pyruvate dehydrogenase complex